MGTETTTKDSEQLKQSKDSAIKFVPSAFKLHVFSTEFSEKKIIFEVIKMMDSCIIFINYRDNPTFSDLSIGMFTEKNKVANTNVIGTKIIGDFTDDTSKSMAIKLAKRLKKVVYLSCNVSLDRLLQPVIERRICDEIKVNPDRF